MKSAIHPAYNSDTKVSCACGNQFTTGSTLEKIDVEVCSQCHPFFTGQHKFVDTRGRIDKLNKRVEQGKEYLTKKEEKKATIKKKG